MNTNHKTTPSADCQRMLESLRQAVAKTLERKRRLGQYAVIWQHGKPAMIHAEAPRLAEDAVSYTRRD
ncbi:MAG: hypothetical protein L0H63_06620 [Nitrococcus sp.]|nr:hypothetical protein [Nitrococcus sp.]